MDQNSATNSKYKPKYQWVAVYKDGSILQQYAENIENSSEEINRKQLRQFLLIDNTGVTKFIQRLKPGQQFIYRARTVMRPGIGVLEKIHVIGWREKESEQIAFVFENGLVEIGEFIDPHSEEFADRPWYYPIQLKDHDFIQVE